MAQDVLNSEFRQKMVDELELGEKILKCVRDIQNTLERAEEAVVDRSGGGMAKYNYINTVQEQVSHLREAVEMFCTSVEGINAWSAERIGNIKLDALFPAETSTDNECMQLYIDADAVIMERITRVRHTVKRVEEQIKDTMTWLDTMDSTILRMMCGNISERKR